MKKKIISYISVLILTSLLFIVIGCESTNDPANSGSLIVKVTDSPFPIDFVASTIVTVSKIEVRQKGAQEENPYIVISEEPLEFDLLELRNGVTSTLSEIEIPVGSYDLVRLYVDGATILLNEGLGEFTLKVPSGDKTGIKIFIDPELQIHGGLTAELLLDFDLSSSFVVQGNMDSPSGIKGFNFKPVIRAVNNQLVGSLEGIVSDPEGTLEGVLVTVTLDENSATAVTDENGYYQIMGLKEGEYTVTADFEGYVSGEANVTITANNKTNQDFEITTL